MSKITRTLILPMIIASITLSSCASVKSYSKPGCNIEGSTIGILPFDCSIGDIGNIVSDTVGANLLDSGCKIIERSYLTKILEEHGLMQAGLTEAFDYTSIGKIVKADYLLVGNVDAQVSQKFMMFGYMAGGRKSVEMSAATARIVDVTTGEVIVSVTVNAESGSTASVQPVVIGELLASGIRKETAKYK